jgi:hypothetical protein
MSGIIAQNTLDNSGLIKAPEGGGAWNFIKKLTASGDSDLTMVNGTDDVVLDSTYKVYLFTFKNIHPSINDTRLEFNLSDDTGSTFAATKTTSCARAEHNESGSGGALAYNTSLDLAQSTSNQPLGSSLGSDNDQNTSGYLHLFNPSSTTFVKHFMARVNETNHNNSSFDLLYGGYANTTSAIDGIKFEMSSGNIDAGDFCLYGLTT